MSVLADLSGESGFDKSCVSESVIGGKLNLFEEKPLGDLPRGLLDCRRCRCQPRMIQLFYRACKADGHTHAPELVEDGRAYTSPSSATFLIVYGIALISDFA